MLVKKINYSNSGTWIYNPYLNKTIGREITIYYPQLIL